MHNLSQNQPIVLFLDDLHLAPQMSLQLHIAGRLKEFRLLIVYAFREGELIERPALVSARNELVRARLVTDIRLEILTEAQTGRMIAHAFGDSVAVQLQAPIYAINRGNPFFVEELLRYLVLNNAVRRVHDGWEVLESTRAGIPESVKLLVQDRVARLGEEAVPVFQQASVLGQEFSFSALSVMANLPEEKLVVVLDQAMASGLIVDHTHSATEAQYGFREDHIRDVLYQSIPATRRRRYHLQAGRALKELYPQRLEELAYHFTNGNDAILAASYSFQAAEQASSLFTWNRAIPLYRDALGLWEELGGHIEERAAAAESLGNACYKSGIEAQRAVGYLRQALSVYQELGNQRKAATIHSQLGREHMHSGNLMLQDLSLALEHFRQAKEILNEESEGIPHGMVYCSLAMAHLDHLDIADALSWVRRALELGERLGIPAVAANACVPLGGALSDFAQANEVLERGWRTSIDSRLGFQAYLSRAYAARIFGVTLKDPRAGICWIERGPDYDTTYSLFDIPAHLLALHTLKGEFDEAGQMLEELQSRLIALGQPTFGLWPDELALLWIRKCEWDHAEAQLSEAMEWAVKSENRSVEASTAQKLGETYLALHQDGQAERYLLRSLELIRGSGSVVAELALLPHLCELYRWTGRLTEAKNLLAEAQNIEGATDSTGLKGDLWLAEAMLADDLEHWEDMEAAFQGAVQVYQEFTLPWDEARAYYEWAVALMGDRYDGSHANRAENLLRRALSLWEPMGASPYAERCRRRLA